MTELYPIESAPKNGTVICLYRADWDFLPKARWVLQPVDGTDIGFWEFDDPSITLGCVEGNLGYYADDFDNDWMPTHWFPIPKVQFE